MDNYREALKNHFVGNPKYAALMNLEYLWCGLGVGLLLLGCLVQVFAGLGAGYLFGSLLYALGFWGVILGMAVAFIKRSDVGMLVAAGGAAIVEIIFFIVSLVRGGGYIFPMDLLVNVIVFVLITVFSFLKSDMRAQRAAAAAYRAQQYAAAMPAVSCPKCGAPAKPGSGFCSVCGTPIPAPQPVYQQQPAYQQPQAQAPQPAHQAVHQQPMPQAPAPAPEMAPVPAPAPAPAVCPNCGKPVAPGDAFCMNCGTSL